MINPDMSQYLSVFLDEAREQLEVLETHILQMEQGDHSPEMLQTLFRAAHTIKGSSRAMGYTPVGELTHKMEDLLENLRAGQDQVTTAGVNLLLRCLDTLTMLIDAIATSGTIAAELEADTAVLVKELAALGNHAAPGSGNKPSGSRDDTTPIVVTDYESTAIADASAAGLNLYQVTVEIHPDCLMKSVRVYMVLGALEPIGSVLVTSPGEEQLDAEEFDLTFQLILAAECDSDAIVGSLAAISEIQRVTVARWNPVGVTEELQGPLKVGDVQTDVDPLHADPADVTAATAAGPTTAVPHGPTIRVDISRLDNLLNLIGEMVIDRTQLARIGAELRKRYPHDDLASQLLEGTHRLARITSELQDEIMKTRMLPIDGVFQRLPRMVRDLAQKTGKEVDFHMSGGETELDRSVLEALGDPLIHLLRNAIDHGVETPAQRMAQGKPPAGHVRLSARHEENHIVIEINDDGRGMNADAIKASAVNKGVITEPVADAMTDRDAIMLIFGSGFSTAETLTDISGRGVGMDIVKSNIERLGGRILVDTTVGEGTRFTIHLPLTLAIVRALTVSAGGGTYVLPLSCVEEMLRLGMHDGAIKRHTIGGQATILLRDTTVPLVSLADVLCGDPLATSSDRIDDNAYVVVTGFGEKRIGLCVDGLGGEQEVVIKSLGTLLGDVPGLAGATILGDGRVALIVDVARAIGNIADMGAKSVTYNPVEGTKV